MNRGFGAFHPAVELLFFALVLTCSMIFTHPACVAVSLCGGVLCLFSLGQGRRAGRTLAYLLPAALLAAAINPAFSHRGATVLAYLPSGNPLTLESVAYGLGAGAVLLGVTVWFACLSRVMTTDKFVYLFGRVIPALALVLSMTLRFIPRFTRQLKQTAEMQAALTGQSEGGGVTQKVGSAVKTLSMAVTWSLENAIDTADSMTARGYGLPGRTAFSLWSLTCRDKLALLWLGLCALGLLAGGMTGGLSWHYYPIMGGADRGTIFWGLLALYLALCLTPAMLNWREERRWNCSAWKG